MTDDQVKELGKRLAGTCKNIDTTLEMMDLENADFYGEASTEQCILLGSITMQCEACGWWFSPDEMGEGNRCLACDGENDAPQ